MKKLIVALVFLSQINVFSQNLKFGKVSKEEIQEKFYSLDSTADAVYLYKHRRTYFDFVNNRGFQQVTEITERIKIYTKEGFNMATKSIYCYDPESGGADPDYVSSIKGYTFNLENGKLIKEKLSKKNIFKERKNKYSVIHKITMPSIKEGSIIELKYKFISPRAGNIRDVKFQYNIPVKKFDCTLEVPEFFIFNKRNTGYYIVEMKKSSKNQTFSNSLTYRSEVYKFKKDNIPALRDDEPYVGSISNYRGGMSFELTQTNFLSVGGGVKTFSNSWEDVSKQIYKSSSFGGELNKTNYYKDDIIKILATTKSDFEKVGAIFQFVKNKMKWNGFYSFYAEKGVKKAYKEQVGNVADINLMLTSMLRFAGLNANPVLVSSKGNGIPIFPTIDGFDYVVSIVEFPNNTYALLDATEPYSMPNILPTRALNWNGRKITKSGLSSWVSLISNKPAIEENTVMVKITEDLTVEGLYRTKYSNLNALNFRRNTNHIKEESLISSFEESKGIEIDNFKIINKKNIGKPITRNIRFLSEDLVESINGKLYIEPLLFLTQRENPFKLEERKFPVDFTSPWKDRNTVSIQIPEGYKVEFLPESMAIGLPNNMGVFKYQVSQKENRISTACIIQFNEAVISSQNYLALKDFYAQLVKKESEKLVLVKM